MIEIKHGVFVLYVKAEGVSSEYPVEKKIQDVLLRQSGGRLQPDMYEFVHPTLNPSMYQEGYKRLTELASAEGFSYVVLEPHTGLIRTFRGSGDSLYTEDRILRVIRMGVPTLEKVADGVRAEFGEGSTASNQEEENIQGEEGSSG